MKNTSIYELVYTPRSNKEVTCKWADLKVTKTEIVD